MKVFKTTSIRATLKHVEMGKGDSCFYVCGNGCDCSGSASGSFCF